MNQPSDVSTSDGITNSTVDHTLKLPLELTSTLNPTSAQTLSNGEKSVLQTVSAPVIPDEVSRSISKHSHDLKIPALADLSTSGFYSDEMEAVNQPAVKAGTYNGKFIIYTV